jgi:hypothetical protein
VLNNLRSQRRHYTYSRQNRRSDIASALQTLRLVACGWLYETITAEFRRLNAEIKTLKEQLNDKDNRETDQDKGRERADQG